MTKTQSGIHSLQQVTADDRFSADIFERRFYAEDMAPVPRLLVRPFFRTVPDAVALPVDAAEVAETLRQAARHGLPIVPRAAATTALYNVVPTRGGLVLDLSRLVGGIFVDEARQIVNVRAGTRWLDLERALGSFGLAAKSYPSSAVAATVGGWFSTQGHGVGSLKYGPLADQVVRAEIVLPDGQIMQATADSDPPLHWFATAEGTLGIVTEIQLTVRPAPAVAAHHLYAFDTHAELESAMAQLARAEPRPFTLYFSDEAHARLLALAGFAVPTSRPVLLISYQGQAAEVAQGQKQMATLPGAEALDGEMALEEWDNRLYHLRVKRGGPSLLAAEMWLPIESLASYLVGVKALGRRYRTLIGTYGIVVSPHRAVVMSVYFQDARQTLAYTLALGLTAQLHRLGARCGGYPYGVGLWNTPYIHWIFSRQQLQELRARKRALDPAGLLNPDKLYRAPYPLWPILFKPAARALATAYRWRGGGGA